ncbi:unnamed protein product [Auanema sp. JU1783]|nr:unnamed protein product [Auanema sp. JU1783]
MADLGVDKVISPDAVPSNTTFTFEEQVITSSALYTMSLICIILGSIRSVKFVDRHIRKKKLIEASITLSEAKKFPFTASLVLFGLYLFFKPDRSAWISGLAQTYLPENIANTISGYLPVKTDDESVQNPTRFLKLLHLFPENIQASILTFVGYLPSLSKENAMTLLLLLLCYEGCVALATILKPLFSFVLNLLPIGNRWPKFNTPYFFSIKKGTKEMEEGDIEDAPKKNCEFLLKLEFDTHDCIALFFCLSVGISHIYQRHWITNNILGIAFSIYGIENLHLSSFKAGTLLLCGLFVYDIFWVFATDVMTSVAKGIDAPILLQFPLDLLRNGYLNANKHSMLGLGDIVIPGIFIALLRRFDHRISETSKKDKTTKNRYFFVITVLAYAIGLVLTMVVMHYFKAAQPALLYLVPCCLLVPLLVASCTGELKNLWEYNEEHLIEKNEKKKANMEKKNN